MEITLADDLYELIRDDVVVTERGEVDVKGFGRKQIYTLHGMTDPDDHRLR